MTDCDNDTNGRGLEPTKIQRGKEILRPKFADNLDMATSIFNTMFHMSLLEWVPDFFGL